MSFDVFISYSSKNSMIATAACAAVEATGAHCWIAPRNIRPGRAYGEAIIEGMNECKILVLIYSTFSNASPQVLREVERAVSKGLEIITMRVEEVAMSKAMEYFLAASHWLDAVTVDTETALARLAEAVKGGLDPQESAAAFESRLPPDSADAGVKKGAVPPANNLPASVTSFVGRSAEKAAIAEALVGNRMVTITGAGGSGKSRLALEVASDSIDHYLGGVWYVDCDRKSGNVGHAILDAMGVKEQPDALDGGISASLAGKPALIVLDNCDDESDDVREISEGLLRDSSSITILATSQHPFHIAGEAIWPIAPFAPINLTRLPRVGSSLVQALAADNSVRLFIERARSVSPSFTLNETNAAHVVEICNRLDGLPLAIELAASRVRVLTPEQISARLNDQFRLLGGNKSGPERQHTLKAALDWSYGLLSDNEQVLLQRLTVFAGPCTIDAIENVCSGDPIDDWDILDLISGLVDKSLIFAEEWEGSYRYGVMQSVRKYAAEKAEPNVNESTPDSQNGALADFRRRHSQWYAQVVEKAEPNLWGPFQQAWMDRLEADRRNWVAAIRWAVRTEDTETALRLGAAVGRFWLLRGALFEASELFGQIANLASTARERSSAQYAKVSNGAGSIAWSRGDLESAREYFENSLSLYRELGDAQRTADLLNNLGNIALDSADPVRAKSLLEEALDSYRSLGDQPGISAATGNLALIALRTGDLDRARDLYDQSLAADRELGDSWAIATSLHGLGLIDCRTGHPVEARAHLLDSLTRRVALDDQNGIAECLEALGELAFGQADPERALRLWGAASAIRESAGATLPPEDRAALDARIADATERVGTVAKVKAWDEGRTWSTEEAVRQCEGTSP